MDVGPLKSLDFSCLWYTLSIDEDIDICFKIVLENG